MAFPVNAEMLDFCVLGILEKEDSYGYGITQKFSDELRVSESTLYPVLRRLKKHQFLETYDRRYQGRNRRYYKITEKGRERLERYREEWQAFKYMIDNIVTADSGPKEKAKENEGEKYDA